MHQQRTETAPANGRDHDIEAPLQRPGLLQRGLHVIFAASVADADFHGGAGHLRAQAATCPFQRFASPPHEDHRRAIAQQRQRAGRTDAAGAAGDEGGLAFQYTGRHHAPRSGRSCVQSTTSSRAAMRHWPSRRTKRSW